MNDETKVRLVAAAIAMMGTISTIAGCLEIRDARHAGDAMQFADGVLCEIGGLLLVMLSLVILIYVNQDLEIKKLQKEREDLLEKMENMRTSNRIFDGRTEAFREDIIVLRDRIDYLEDRMQKESVESPNEDAEKSEEPQNEDADSDTEDEVF